MTEQTQPPQESIIDYQDRRLKLKNIHSDPYGNPINGYEVSVDGIRYEFAHAKAWEGMYLGSSEENGESLVEPKILEINFIGNHTPEKGLGTLLTRFVLEEARRRGFKRARMIIHNPQVIKIIERLRQEEAGPIEQATYFEDYPDLKGYPSTAELFARQKQITAEEGLAYLAEFEADDEGFVNYARVDSVLDL